MLKSWAVHVCLFQSIAVTFGTATSSSKDAGVIIGDSKISRFSLFSKNLLTTQAQTIHDFVITFDVRSLQVIQQTPPLLDHFQQAAPRMIILLVSLEMLGQVVNSLTQQGYLYLRRTGVGLMGTEVRHNLFFRFFC
jgi:hypothetical protein